MRKQTLGVGALLLGILTGGMLLLPVGGQEPPRPSGLQLAFAAGDSRLEVKSGSFNVTTALKDAPGARPVLIADPAGKLPQVLETPTPQTGPREVRVFFRLRTDAAATAAASVAVAKRDSKDPGLRLALSTARGAPAISCQVTQGGKPLHDAANIAPGLQREFHWTPTVPNGFSYHPRAYALKDIRPGWPEDFRLRIEHDMSKLPDVPDKWLEVRIQLRESVARFWLDDRLVATKNYDGRIDGLTAITLSPGVQLAGYEVAAWKPAADFEPVPLAGYANARAFLGNASVKLDSVPATVDGIPFVVPTVNAEGKDHIDVGLSLFRQANQEGYHPSNGPRWAGSAFRDPARIQLRIPHRNYDRLHLLAACDSEPNSVPLITATFYRPGAGFAERFEAQVPLATAQSSEAKAVPVTLSNGKQTNLWLVTIPLDPGKLSAFSDAGIVDTDIVELELTKKAHLYRSYPDPFIYGWHQGGPPSAVHVYALTLGESPVSFGFEPDQFGHVWTAPREPYYKVEVLNQTGTEQKGKLTFTTRSYDGSEQTKGERTHTFPKNGFGVVAVEPTVKLYGYHDLTLTLEMAGRTWTEKRSFVRLAPDTRAERWTEGKGALFGYWSYHGGHNTPKAEHIVELMTRAGARTSSMAGARNDHPLIKKHWTRVQAGAWEVSLQPWSAEEPIDPKKYEAYQKQVLEAFGKYRDRLPAELRPDHVYFFPEPHVSQRLTEGNYPEYWQGEPYQYTDEEKKRLRMFMVTAKCAAEAVRKQWPELKILIPWGDALFAIPLLRAGFPKHLIDGSGIDTPGFERLPEMQLHQISVHRLYQLRKEYEKAGIADPVLQYCEGIFVPTEPGACSWREQMDLYHRWTLLSMAYGVKRFYSGWFAFDCGSYYGAEHYGGCGIQRRIPYCDPKPAYAAYATMTDKLDQANFDGWLKTGSLTTYCLRFKGPKGPVHTLWTLRGKRPVTLTLSADGEIGVTDSMNNTRKVPSKNKQVTVGTDPSVIYVTGAEVVSVAVGEPDHSDARPPKDAKPVADLGDGTWSYTSQRNETYEKGTFAVARYPGKFASAVVADPEQGKVLRSTLEKQDALHQLMPWYNVLAPKKPVVLAGAPSHLGLWVKGASDWGRVVYVLKDARGEKWTSIGYQDQYNCDDVHSWSAFNFDGWRYLRFELPGHTGYDSFRRHGTTWWRSDDGDGIVDLPLTLENVIVEQRSHLLYVNDVQPAVSAEVCLGKLFVEYDTSADALPAAVAASRLRLARPVGVPDLPNPIVEHEKTGTGEPTVLQKVEPPLERNDGTTVFVHFQETPGAKRHFVWVSARADGRGAVNMTPNGAKSGVLLRGLRAELPFHFWVTYEDAQGKMSKPSKPLTATLKDTFKEK